MRFLSLCVAAWPGLALAEMSVELTEAREQYLSGNYNGIWEVVQAEAERGDVVAQNMLGAALTTPDGSKGIGYDPAAGLAWYEKAASQGFDKAVYNLALFWQNDHEGFEPDYVLSRELAEKATHMGYIHAPNLIGDMFYTGKGWTQDFHKAFVHYKQAADMGSFIGARAVGYAYFYGEGVERDIELTRDYLDQAVSGGDTLSIPDLAFLYEGTEGIPADPLRAYTLYRYGVDRGNAKSAYWLAFLSEKDQFDGVWRNPVEGYGYCLHAMELGLSGPEVQAECDRFGSDLSESDQKKAQDFAADLAK